MLRQHGALFRLASRTLSMRPAQALVELRRFSASSGPAHAVPGQTFSKIGVLTLKARPFFCIRARQSVDIIQICLRLSTQDGTRLEGVSFGAEVNVAGEAVFNTGAVWVIGVVHL